MNKIQNFNSTGAIKICKSDLCIEARSKNARLIVGAVIIALVCVGLAALIKANR